MDSSKKTRNLNNLNNLNSLNSLKINNNNKILTLDKNIKIEETFGNDESETMIESVYDSVNMEEFVIIKNDKFYIMDTSYTPSTIKYKNSFPKKLIQIPNQPHILNIVSLSFNKNIMLYAKNNGESYITDGDGSDKANFENKINIQEHLLAEVNSFSLKNVFKLTGSLNKKYLVKVKCGRAHVIFMTHAGMVFSFGEGSKGQLGHGSYNSLQEPNMITSLLNYRFTDISVGADHNWAIATVREISKKNLSNSFISDSDKNKEQIVYVWGDNSKGQLGLDINEWKNVNTPMMYEKIQLGDSLIKKIDSGVEHTLILLENDKVFGVGSNEFGQINTTLEENKFSSPQRLKLNFSSLKGINDKVRFKTIKTSAFSSLFYTEDNKIYVIGKFNKASSNFKNGNNTCNTEIKFDKLQTVILIQEEYDSDIDFIFTDFSLILLYDSKICNGHDLKYQELIEQEDLNDIGCSKENFDNLNSVNLKKNSILTEDEKLAHLNLNNNIKNISLKLEIPDSINFGIFRPGQTDECDLGELDEFEQENDLNASKLYMLENSSVGDLFDPSISFEQSIEELRSYINLVGISYVADRGSAYAMSFRPKNLPKKTPQEESYHRKLVEENRKKYMKFLKEKQEEEKKMKALSEKRKLKNIKLQDDWQNNILPHWFAKKKDQNFLKKYFYEGIPTNLRGKIWLLCIGNNFSITPDYYEIEVKKAIQILIEVQENEKRLIEKDRDKDSRRESLSPSVTYHTEDNVNSNLAPNNDDQSAKLKTLLSRYNITVVDKERSIQFIELDIDRTFSYLGIFKSNSPLSEDLREILRAFVASRPDIGYVQGLSYIAGTLLLNMEKYQAFVALMNLTLNQNIIPFYRFDERQIRNRLQIFKQIFYHNLPELCDYFEELDILPEHYLIEWTMTLFSKNLNIDIVARIWDIYMIEGIKSIYQAAIVILSHFEKKFIESDFEFIMLAIKNINTLNFDEDQFVEMMKQVKFPLWIEHEIQKLKDEYIPI